MGLCSKVPTVHIFAVVLGSLEIVLFGGVIFGWHSVVYVYKDVGYFSEGCSAQTPDPSVINATVQYHTPGYASYNSSQDNLDRNGTVSVNSTRSLPGRTFSEFNLTTPGYEGPDSNKGSSIRFEELSCKEQMQVHAEVGVSQVCASQDEQFNLIFSLATGINGILSFPSGFLYDRMGTRISRFISIVSFMVGQLCLICASQSNPYLLYPGFTGLVYGGYQILLTNLQLSGLIPSLRSTIMSLYSGSYDTSSSIFLLFKAGHEAGFSINAAFGVHATMYFLICVSSTLFFLPKNRIPNPLYPGYRLRCSLCHLFCKNKGNGAFTNTEWKVDLNGSIIRTSGFAMSSTKLDGQADPAETPLSLVGEPHPDDTRTAPAVTQDEDAASGPGTSEPEHGGSEARPKNAESSDPNAAEGERMLEGETQSERKTFRQVALSPLFLTDLVWMSVQRLRSWIFIGMFNPWITRLACGDKALVSHYTSVYAGLQFFGILTAPLSGRLMDRKIKGAEKYGNPKLERLHASIASFVLNSSVSVLLTICTLIPVLKLQYLTFFLHCLHRSFLYGPNSAFVANGFPSEHFGKLFGVTLTVSAAFSMLQYPLFLIMQGPLGGDPLAINVFLLVLMIISFAHPLCIWRYLQKKLAKTSV